jgi:teichuronic acid biosynthesis protein TuaF
MTSILNRVALRAKKLLILLIIIPLLTGAISYYLESKKSTTYTASSSVNVGNSSNDFKADFSSVEDSIKSKRIIGKIKKSAKAGFNIADVKARLVVTPNKNIIKFQYSGTDEKEVNNTLTSFSDGFVKMSNKIYDKKYKQLNASLSRTEKIVSSQEMIKKEDLIASLQSSLDNLSPAYVNDPVQVIASYSNPLKRGIFGLILGLMLDFVILVLPELFREYR